MAALESGELDCVFATYQLAKEGLDIPTLDNLFMATPQKNETVVTQSAGRVARKASFVADRTCFKIFPRTV